MATKYTHELFVLLRTDFRRDILVKNTYGFTNEFTTFHVNFLSLLRKCLQNFIFETYSVNRIDRCKLFFI